MAARSSDLIGASSFVRDFDETTTCPCNIFEKPYVDYGISQGMYMQLYNHEIVSLITSCLIQDSLKNTFL